MHHPGELDAHLGVEHGRADRAGRVDDREHRRRGDVAKARLGGRPAVEVDGVVLADRVDVFADLLAPDLVDVRVVGLALRAVVDRHGAAGYLARDLPKTPRATVRLRGVAEALRFGERAELAQRALLDLAGAHARQAEHARGLVEGLRLLVAQPVAQLDDAALAVGEVLEYLDQALVHHRLRGQLIWRGAAVVLDRVAELRGVRGGAEGLVEGDWRRSGAHDQVGRQRIEDDSRGWPYGLAA